MVLRVLIGRRAITGLREPAPGAARAAQAEVAGGVV